MGSKIQLLDVPAINLTLLADHGSVAWGARLAIVGSEADGQGEPVKLAHLLGKDSYDILEKTVNPDLRKAFELLQASSLLVVGVGKVKECFLVPRNVFINALALPIPGFFMEPPKDNGNDNQKVLVKNNSWNEIRQSGYFIFNKVEKAISGVGWQVSS